MTKEEEKALLEKVALLEKEKEEQGQLLQEALKQNEELALANQAKKQGKYAAAYSEDGIDYIVKAPKVFDIALGKKVDALDYFIRNKGEAAKIALFENDLIEKKGGNA